MSGAGRVRVGIGGWVYPPWRGSFYPKGLPQKEELAHASRRVTAIEINGTFYRLQTPATFRKWRGETPEDFVFSLKGPRFLTHRSDFADAGPLFERFLDSGILELGPKLGPILWQFAPNQPFDEARFAAFLDLLPQERAGHALRHVVEVRHQSFAAPGFAALLERHRVALARVDDAHYPEFAEATADFRYFRLRRCAEVEPQGYPPASLDRWADELRRAAADRDCFLYFINGAKIRAPAAAQTLLDRLAAQS